MFTQWVSACAPRPLVAGPKTRRFGSLFSADALLVAIAFVGTAVVLAVHFG